MNYSKINFYIIILSIISIALFLLSISMGTKQIPIAECFQIIFNYIKGENTNSINEVIIFFVRLPRIIIVFIVGASLGIAGSITQGMFRNPLASPDILGINSGALLAIILGIIFNINHTNTSYSSILLGVLGAVSILLILLFLLYSFNNTTYVLLFGFSISIILSSISTIIFIFNSSKHNFFLRTLEWVSGSFEGKTWEHLNFIIYPFLLFCFIAYFLHKPINLLHLGRDVAVSLGMNEKKVFALSIITIAVLIGTSTAIAGAIGFVGLFVPHICRFLVGNNYKYIIIFSFFIGGCFLLLVDIISRSFLDIYIPPGIVTNIVGALFFIYLIFRQEKKLQN